METKEIIKVWDNGILREMTESEVAEFKKQNTYKSPLVDKEAQIQELKEKLADSDYKAIKYAEGWISEEDYAPTKAERQAIRDAINKLEQEV